MPPIRGLRKIGSKDRRRRRRSVFKRDGSKCVYCGSTENLTLGHKIPWAKGGRNTIENMQVECYECNYGKGCNYVEVPS